MSQNPVVDVGMPVPGFQEWATAEVRYHGFADLPTTRGQGVKSPEFTCLGHRWFLKVFPGGTRTSENGTVAVYLRNASDTGIKIVKCFFVRNGDGSVVARSALSKDDFRPKSAPGRGYSKGRRDFAARSDLIDFLVEGTLLIEVRMKLFERTNMMRPTPFVPKNPSACKIIQDLFMDKSSADVVFEVEEQSGKSSTRNSFKVATSTFYAHRFILEKCSSTLAELCSPGGDQSNPVPISDVKPSVFHHLLRYIYGGELSDDDLKPHAKEVIDSADKYGVTNLKLEAEAFYVQSLTITVSNVLEHLIYADSKNCALLKEATVDFIVENKVEILEEVSFKHVSAGIVTDVLASVARVEEKNGNDNSSIKADFGTMGISDLRRKVHEKGLDIDGSREALIASLKENP